MIRTQRPPAFDTPLTGALEWVVIGYLVVIGALLLTFGRLSDMIGRAPIWIAGLAVFTIRRWATIVNGELIKRVSGLRHFLAELAGFDGAYLRFTGSVRLEHFVNGELVEDVNDAGIWEMMYFGHVYR